MILIAHTTSQSGSNLRSWTLGRIPESLQEEDLKTGRIKHIAALALAGTLAASGVATAAGAASSADGASAVHGKYTLRGDGTCFTDVHPDVEQSDCGAAAAVWSVHEVASGKITLSWSTQARGYLSLNEGRISSAPGEATEGSSDPAWYDVDKNGVLRVSDGPRKGWVLSSIDRHVANRPDAQENALRLYDAEGKIFKGGVGSGEHSGVDVTKPQILEAQKPVVIFVHGMNDSASAFDKMKEEFKKTGWRDDQLYAWEYDGWRDSNSLNAQRFDEMVQKKFSGNPIHIVAHSLGSIPTRLALKGDPHLRSSVKTWTSLGGPNKGAGDSLLGVGLATACVLGGDVLGPAVGSDLITDSTCELAKPWFRDKLNSDPTPQPTDYEEVYSDGDTTVANWASKLPETSNNHVKGFKGVKHGDLPRDSGIIAHVVERVNAHKSS
ncbi:esterase/lipase family protein [Streptomyces lavendulae]|uniref:esterase/lipase family protein n=1 Tax=Streptomyces lavendulae TaxID=1914 RepID=UPI003722B874